MIAGTMACCCIGIMPCCGIGICTMPCCCIGTIPCCCIGTIPCCDIGIMACCGIGICCCIGIMAWLCGMKGMGGKERLSGASLAPCMPSLFGEPAVKFADGKLEWRVYPLALAARLGGGGRGLSAADLRPPLGSVGFLAYAGGAARTAGLAFCPSCWLWLWTDLFGLDGPLPSFSSLVKRLAMLLAFFRTSELGGGGGGGGGPAGEEPTCEELSQLLLVVAVVSVHWDMEFFIPLHWLRASLERLRARLFGPWERERERSFRFGPWERDRERSLTL